MSAEIIAFIACPRGNRAQTDFPTIAFRSVARPDDLVMDHADPAIGEDVHCHCGPHGDEPRR